ncbi:MAG: hypothetical protein JWO13_2983 [Acidobacteriales bacterium]|nr:hypothetical protein [Terriglobales bacterium]
MVLEDKTRRGVSGFGIACLIIILINGLIDVALIPKANALFSGASDFAAFYTAGKIVAQGNGGHLYDKDTQSKTELQYTPYPTAPLLFYHPAFEALLFAPLAWLPYRNAFLWWNFLNLLVLLSIPMVLRKHIAIVDRNFIFSTVALLLFFPVLLTFLQGQDSIVLLLCYALAFVCFRSGRDFRAGTFLALALFKFQLVLPFVFLVSLCRQWKVVRGFFVGGVGAMVANLIVTGPRGLWEFPRFLLNANQNWTQGNIFPYAMANIRGFISSTGNDNWAKVAILVCSVLVMAAVFLATRKEGRSEELQFALMMLATLLVSYHLNPHDLTLLALPLGIAANHVVTGTESRAVRLTLIVTILILFAAPTYLLLLSSHKMYLLSCVILVLGATLMKTMLDQRASDAVIAAASASQIARKVA